MSSPTFTQQNFYLAISTPLGPDKLLPRSLRGEESLSRLFQFTLELESEDPNIDFDSIVGQNATVEIATHGGAKRYINGVVSHFTQSGRSTRFVSYHAELRPWLWLLTLNRDCKIFQQKSAPDILEAVFGDAGFSDYRNDLNGSYNAREYCVQYQETAFHFVSRLMEEEGIYYYFDHEDGKHTLVFADDSGGSSTLPDVATLRYGSRRGGTVEMADDIVSSASLEQEVTPNVAALDDYNFETPSTDLFSKAEGPATDRKVYEYPGRVTDKSGADTRTGLRLEAHQVNRKVLRGESFCRAFSPGYKFTLSEHYRDDWNQSYVLQHLSHQASEAGYSNSFEAIPSDVKYRPPLATPKPVMASCQSAVVVGKKGEEIWTDKYGRVKVQFHWDQDGKQDENSSCWIRVNQGWAGKQWGSLFLPRIGQEVLVDFLNGDPDRPVVTGAVYNAEQTVPYALPSEQTKSTVKTRSTKEGSGSNEIRFEDKKDSEELFVHAQKDMNIEVENDRTATIKEGNETLMVQQGDRTVQVQQGKETHEVESERSLTITGDESHDNAANFTHTVSGDYELSVSGNLTIDVSGSVTVKSGTSLTNQAGTSLTNKAGTSLTNQAGTSLTNKGGASLTNKAPTVTNKADATQTVDGGGMLTVKGGLVKIN